jgi:ribosome biogenesis protein BRX1
LNPIRIFGGSFGGPTLYQNSEYVSPNAVRFQAMLFVDTLQIRASAKVGKAGSYVNRIMDKQALKDKRDDALTIPPIQDYTEDVFQE